MRVVGPKYMRRQQVWSSNPSWGCARVIFCFLPAPERTQVLDRDLRRVREEQLRRYEEEAARIRAEEAEAKRQKVLNGETNNDKKPAMRAPPSGRPYQPGKRRFGRPVRNVGSSLSLSCKPDAL